MKRLGFTVFLTGLSGAGKSTTATALASRLEKLGRSVTSLDGDAVRMHLSKGLGFSRDDRDTNIRRVAFVAGEVTRHGGACICANIAPYASARNDARRMIESLGGFVLVHIATSIAVCESRDPKGLYKKARAGQLPGFTGVSDPYETPTDAEVTIDTATMSPADAAEQIVRFLSSRGYL